MQFTRLNPFDLSDALTLMRPLQSTRKCSRKKREGRRGREGREGRREREGREGE
jgi:hypothetical protein